MPVPGWEIELRTYKRVDLLHPTILCGVSSVGLLGPIVGSQLVEQLRLDQVCAIESPLFPPVSMIYVKKPKFPARIYASKRLNVAVVLAEFAPGPDLARPMAHAILHWARDQAADRIIAFEGFVPSAEADEGISVAGTGSTEEARLAIERARLPLLEQGAITGVAGVLLNEGRWQQRDVIALVAPGGTDLRDTRAAVTLLDALPRLVPHLRLKLEGLSSEATRLEAVIRSARERLHPEFA